MNRLCAFIANTFFLYLLLSNVKKTFTKDIRKCAPYLLTCCETFCCVGTNCKQFLKLVFSFLYISFYCLPYFLPGLWKYRYQKNICTMILFYQTCLLLSFTLCRLLAAAIWKYKHKYKCQLFL